MQYTSRKSIIPAPEVQHLTTIFRRIQSGEIRIPAFQRGYVWQDEQVIELLSSVYKGYPIGSILLWKADHTNEIKFEIVDEQSEFDDLPSVPFPRVNNTESASFILDGVQRLSTLYGVFFSNKHGADTRKGSDVFDVVFDLEESIFLFAKDIDVTQVKYIQLSDVFTPKRLLDAQRNMVSTSNSETLIDASLELQARFQDYLLPVVTISSVSVEDVVEIFERVNTTGTRLSRVDFMRALTWSDGFDFNLQIQDVRRSFESGHFQFSPETLIKSVTVILDKEPTPRAMLELRKSTAPELLEAVQKSRNTLQLVTDFLKSQCSCYSSDFVPYEGQILTMLRLFQRLPTPDDNILSIARRWFWSTSFNETLRGKPDSYVTLYIRSVNDLINGTTNALSERLTLRSEDLIERRMIVGKALSSAVAMMFAANKCRSFVTGEVIATSQYMERFLPENYQPVLPMQLVNDNQINVRNVSAKIMANLCVVSSEDLLHMKGGKRLLLEYILSLDSEGEDSRQVLESQFISSNALTSLKNGEYRNFLRARSETMFDKAKQLSLE